MLILGTGAAGVTWVSSQSASAEFAAEWVVEDASIRTEDGKITDVVFTGDESYLELDWEEFTEGEDIHIELNVKATDSAENDHLDDGATEYETILNTTYTVEESSGRDEQTFVELFDGESFPVSIPGRHSGLSVEDFESETEGESEIVELQSRVVCEAESASDGGEDVHQVEVLFSDSTFISGTVTESGRGIDGVKVYIVNTVEEVVSEVTRTDTNGEYEVELEASDEFHIFAQYNGTGTKYGAYSNPFIEP